jgi:hypothetical protein
MKSLTYARDNRLRLWFLGEKEWRNLDSKISPKQSEFTTLMTRCFDKWSIIQQQGDYCVLIIGDIIFDKKKNQSIPEFICEIANRKGYNSIEMINDPINCDHKTVRKDSSVKVEKICVFRKDK